ncbi:2-oxo acid dehydrogenase subunit E2 [Paenibacillus sp. MZ04-78.2]|uniref:dihydrolipoamide acetyltransferase family protein n=1 Tax=Paenibacillus sp. MZ04-78.2 TaxID=2962034 RepID=UPI0020B7D584|nr:dihydrolipoamide acetyltransferase family protein [Paenibacillus sp. MZ04-78.2]MCP3772759.1 2-oxo acid dehydrogenase subunit E2 [Paenibacillus sp. MZ04-78.2]
MIEFRLPDVGEGMHEGEITKWLIKEGDFVKQDQPVLEVQTDKVNAELTSPTTGVITKILFAEGETVEVGTTLYLIQGENEVAATAAEPEKVVAAPQARAVEAASIQTAPTAGRGRALATPYVRQLARELSINLEDVIGTGPAGRVTESDLKPYSDGEQVQVEQPAKAAVSEPQKEGEERIPLKGIRKKIAEHMMKSVSLIPHVTHMDELEMDAVKEWRDRLKPYAETKNVKLTFLPFFIKAIVIALKEFKTLNASIDEKTNEIVLKHYYHIGIATDTKEGLIVPVVKHADQKSIFELAAEISGLAARAKEGSLTLDQITGSTFTISNVGPIGGLYATPIINHPEAAILALHKMEPRMVVRDWEGVIRLMMNMSLSFDHRLIDGVTAVRFTNRIKELLENPNLLFAEMK